MPKLQFSLPRLEDLRSAAIAWRGGTGNGVALGFRIFACFVLASAAVGQVANPWETYLASGVSAAEQKRFPAANQAMAMALREAEKFGAADPRLASTLNTIGLVAMAEDKPAEAEAAYRRALAIFEKLYGPRSLDVANVGLNMTRAANQTGKSEVALPVIVRSREIFESVLGKQSMKAGQALFEQGEAYRRLHRYEEAETTLKQAANLQESQGGIDNAELANSLNALALTYAAQGKYAQAEPIFKLSLNIREAKYGLNNRDVMASLDAYAAMLREAGRYKDSVPLTTLSDVVRKSLAKAPQDGKK